MGWQDAPVVDDEAPAAAPSAAQSTPAWMSAPEVATPADTTDQVSRRAQQDARAAETNQDQTDRGVANGRLAPSFTDQLAEPWHGETMGSLFKQNAFIRLGTYLQRKAELSTELEGKLDDDPKAPTDRLQRQAYLNDQVDAAYKKRYAKEQTPDIEWSKLPKQVVKAVTDNPAGFVSQLVKGFVVDPEMLFNPELGAARAVTGVGKAAQATRSAARAGEVGATMGAQSAGISAAQQLEETGDVSGTKVAQEGVTGAAMGVALMGGIEAAKVAADVGIRAVAARKGATVSKEVKAEIDTAIDTAVASGTSPTDALIATLKKHGMAEGEAEHMAAAIEPTQKPKEPSNATDTKGQEGQTGNEQGVRSEEGDAGVLRDGEQGQGEGAGQEAQGERQVAPPPAGPPKKATPDQSLRIMLGNKGARTIEFPDAMDKEVFIYGSKASKRFNAASDAELSRNNAYLRDQQARVSRYLGLPEDTPLNDVVRAAKDFRERTIDFARSMPEDSRVQMESAAKRAPKTEPGDLPPLEFTKEPAPPQSKEAPVARAPDDGTWFHYTREPGVRELDPAKSNPGNARGPGVYLSKDASYSGSHKAPRKDKQGNLAAESQPGELLTTKLEPTREARLFDEGTMLSPDEARGLLSDAGMENTEIGQVLGRMKAVSGKRVNAALNKFFGGEWRHSNAFLKEKGYTGVKFADAQGRQLASVWDKTKAQPPGDWGKQAGRIDPKMLAALGLASIGGMGVYALTGDKSKAIGVAAAMGLLPFAKGIVSRLGKGVAAIDRAIGTDRRFDTKQVFRNYYRDTQVPNYAVDAWKRGIEAMLKGVPDVKASYERIRDYTQGHRDAELTPQEAAAAGELRKFLDHMGQRGQNADVLRALIEDYLPGLYQKKPFQSWRDVINALAQEDAFRGNYAGMSPSSKHALQKVIPDYRTVDALIKAGKLDLVPLTDNPFEMAALYAKSLNKSIANKTLVKTLQGTFGPSVRTNHAGETVPLPLIVPLTTRDAAARIAQGNAIRAQQMHPHDPVAAEDQARIWNRFDILRAPQDYVPVQHTALEGLRVHKDIVEPLKLLFDTTDPGTASKALYALSMAAKSTLFSFSLFHAGALATVAATLASVPGRIGFIATKPSLWRAIPGARRMLMDTQFHAEVADGLTNGLTLFHHVQDVDPTFMQRAFNLAEKYATGLPAYTGMPAVAAVKGMKYAHKAINDFLWGQVHPTLKLATYMAETKRWLEKNPTADADAMAKGKREIAEGVNTLYGGINWFELANNVEGGLARTLATALFSPQGRRWQQVLLLSPDWNIAAARAWSEGAKAAMPGLDAKASDSMYKAYLLMSGLTYLGLADALQQHYTKQHIWEKDDWTTVDMGDGRRIQLNKHFMEVPHLLSDPVKFMLNKLNFVPKETLVQVFSKEYLTHKANAKGGDDFYGPPMKDRSATGRVVHAAKALVSPITVQNLFEDPAKAVSGFFGIPVYGSTFEQQAARKAEAKAKRSAAKSKG